MTDMLASEGVAFLNGFDLLRLDERESFADLPDKAKVCLLISQAEFISVQRTSPLMDFTLPQLLLMDLADNFLSWCADPTNPARWEAVFDCRAWIDDVREQ
jgi:hypothetical protein